MRWPLRYQLLLPTLALLLAVVAGGAWAVGVSAERAARTQIEEQIRNIGASLAAERFPLAPNVLDQLKSLTGADYVVVRPAGTWLTTNVEARGAGLPADVVVDTPEQIQLRRTVPIGTEEYLVSGLRLRRPPGEPPATLYILYPANRWRDAVAAAYRPALWLGAIGGLAAVALAFLSARRLSRRVQAIQEQTHRIAAGDFSPMPVPALDDELRGLAGAVNEMARQLAQLQETVKNTERLRLLGQVGGGLAHELRNGVTGARLAVQLHAQGCDNGADREALDVALRQLALVEERLRGFLDLGRTGAGERRACDLARILHEAVELWRPRCRHNRIEVRDQRTTDTCVVLGDQAQLAHLCVNVLGNAIEAAGPGGWIETRIARHAGECRIEILDSGAGLPAELAERAFEPFVTTKPEGVGLGLAVARQVAEAHGGTLIFERVHGHTCFTIRLPVHVAGGES